MLFKIRIKLQCVGKVTNSYTGFRAKRKKINNDKTKSKEKHIYLFTLQEKHPCLNTKIMILVIESSKIYVALCTLGNMIIQKPGIGIYCHSRIFTIYSVYKLFK